MGSLQGLFARWMRPAWQAVGNALAMPKERKRHRLKGLQELEERCLLSATPINLGHTSQASTASATTLSWSHKVAGGANRILIVGVSEGGNNVTSVTYGGVALTMVGVSQHNSGVNTTSEVWELVAPAVGTANVVISLGGGNTSIVGGAADFSGVNQSTPTGGFVAANGTGGNPSVSVVSAAGDLVIGVAAAHARSSSNPGAGETQLWMHTVGGSASDAWGAGASANGASSTTISWTTTGSGAGEWAAGAVSLLPAATTTLTTSETGTSASFTISLGSQPTASVTINLTNGNPAEGALSQTSLTFTTANWNQAQTVTVTGLDDHIVHGDQTYQITGIATSADPNYNNLVMSPVTVINKEADLAGTLVSGSSFLVAADNSVLRVDALTGAVLASYPTGVANDGSTFGPDGSLYVADYSNHRILHYDPTGAFLGSFGSGQLNSPQGLAFGPDGNLYVTDTNSTVQKFSPAGGFLGTFITAGSGGLSNAKAIVWGPDGDAYVSSYSNSKVLRYDGATGSFLNVFATGSGGFEDLTFGPDKNLYVASFGNDTVYRYRGTDGTSLGAFVSGGHLSGAYGLAFDPAGNLVVSSRSDGSVQVFDGATGGFLHDLATGLANPAYITTTTSLVTAETGTSARFTVQLTSQPTADVTVNLSVSNAAEGTLSQSVLTFHPSNWNTPQTVTVTGLDDHIVHGDQVYQVTGTLTSTDSNYNGLTMNPVSVVNKEADTVGFTVTPTSIETSKAGASASFTVALTSQPTSTVTINLTSTNPSEGNLSQASLTFDASDWSSAQTVTVTGLNDLAAGNVTYQIKGNATSSDSHYNSQAMTPVTVTNKDVTSAGFIVTPTSLQTSESGTTASFSIALTTLPIAPVTVNLTNGNPVQGSLSQNSLTFNLLNWNVPQSVTVTGLDDHIINGDQTYQITGTATSLDLFYNGQTISPVQVVNQETDKAGFTLSKTSLVTSETGTTDSFTIALTSRPAAAVHLTLAVPVPGQTQGSLSQSTLTFSPGNWNTPQTVTVTGLDDQQVNGDQTYQITGTTTSADANFSSLAMPYVTVVNHEADSAGFTVTPAAITTSETGTTASFSVALTSKPLAPVLITLGSTQAGEGSLSQTTLQFDASNWNIAQSVTVTGLDDHIVHGDQTYQINGVAQSADTVYDGQSMTPVTVTNQEADVVGFTFTKTSLTTSETGTTDSFGVALTSQPLAPVTVNFNPTAPAEGTLSQTSLTFDASDWNVLQTVTVTGLDDHIVHGDQTYQIHGTATSGDGHYNGLPTATVTVVNQEADVAGVQIAPAQITTADNGTAASFSVALLSEPTATVTIHFAPTASGQGTLSQTSLTFDATNWNAAQSVTVTGQSQNGQTGTVSYVIRGTAMTADSIYQAASIAPVTVINVHQASGAPASDPVSTPTAPITTPAAQQTLARFIVAITAAPATTPLSATSSPAANNTTVSTQGASVALLATTTSTPGAPNIVGPEADAAGGPKVGAGFEMRRPSIPWVGTTTAWSRANVDMGPSDNYVPPPQAESEPELVTASRSASPRGQTWTTDGAVDLVRTALEEIEEPTASQDVPEQMQVLVSTGLIASAGYLLLNTRTGFWLLSLMAARPLWKQFDPLEILYAWEQNEERETDEETLVSLVD